SASTLFSYTTLFRSKGFFVYLLTVSSLKSKFTLSSFLHNTHLSFFINSSGINVSITFPTIISMSKMFTGILEEYGGNLLKGMKKGPHLCYNGFCEVPRHRKVEPV